MPKRKRAVPQGQVQQDKFAEAAADFRGGPPLAAGDIVPAAPAAPAPAPKGSAVVYWDKSVKPPAAPPKRVYDTGMQAPRKPNKPRKPRTVTDEAYVGGTGSAIVHWYACGDMHEVEDASADLIIGASVYSKGVPWEKYVDLYHQAYNHAAKRILKPGGYFVTLQVAAYVDGGVLPPWLLANLLIEVGKWRLLDLKIWQRSAADFAHVCVWGLPGSRHTRAGPNRHKGYHQGVWDYPQAAGALAAYPAPVCKLLVEAFTKPGGHVVDCFAGTGLLLGIAKALGRHAVGYEANKDLQPVVAKNMNTGEFSLLKQAELFAPTGVPHA